MTLQENRIGSSNIILNFQAYVSPVKCDMMDVLHSRASVFQNGCDGYHLELRRLPVSIRAISDRLPQPMELELLRQSTGNRGLGQREDFRLYKRGPGQTADIVGHPHRQRNKSSSGFRPQMGAGQHRVHAGIPRCTFQQEDQGEYLKGMYAQGLEEGVIYWETRKGLGGLYEINPDPKFEGTNGQSALPGFIDADIDLTEEVISSFKQDNPNFVGHKRIYYSLRFDSPANLESQLERLHEAMEKYPDQRDRLGFGRRRGCWQLAPPLHRYLHPTERSGNRESKVPLYLHIAETNFLEDLITTGNDVDSVATIQNLYESLLLKTERIGQGLGFYKHPYLLKKLKDSGTPIEVTLVANQMLGYTPDIRNHPGQLYYRMGIPITISGNDPSLYGYDEVTVDWYEAFMSWALNLGDLKTIAFNSLQYSAMNGNEKITAMGIWDTMWDDYIAKMSAEACSEDFSDKTATFGQILPNEGALTGKTKVHLFGRNFEVGMCETITCQFGDLLPSPGFYISNQHIICEAPVNEDGQARTVPVSVVLGEEAPIDTGFTFSYKFPSLTGN